MIGIDQGRERPKITRSPDRQITRFALVAPLGVAGPTRTLFGRRAGRLSLGHSLGPRSLARLRGAGLSGRLPRLGLRFFPFPRSRPLFANGLDATARRTPSALRSRLLARS